MMLNVRQSNDRDGTIGNAVLAPDTGTLIWIQIFNGLHAKSKFLAAKLDQGVHGNRR